MALRVLMVDGSAAGIEPIVAELARAFDPVHHLRVGDESALRASLADASWDLVIAELQSPQISARKVLEILRETTSDVPCIVVSGNVGEESADALMEDGARDFLVKSRLERLNAIVKREQRDRLARHSHRAAEARYRTLFEKSPIPKWLFDPNTLRFLEVNEAAVATYGYSREEFLSMSILDIRPPEEVPKLERELEHLQLDRTLVGWRHRKKDGSIIDVEISGQILADERRLVVARDVSERKRSEEAVRASNLRFQRLYDSGIVGIAIADGNGDAREANDAFLNLLGYSRADLAAGVITRERVISAESRKLVEERGLPALGEGRLPPYELLVVRKDGSKLPVLMGGAATEEGWLSFIVDLSDRCRVEAALQRSEEQLRQAQKMEAIGVLAGGVAHDFNNLLSVILSYAEMTIQDLPEGDPLRGDVAEITNAARRASELTRQLLAFSRQQVLQPRIVEVSEVVGGLHKMLRRLIGEDIELETITGPGKIEVDPGQLEQVIMNLAVNARDAMPDGGKLIIETAAVELDEQFAALHVGVRPGSHVMIAVSDSGIGMDPATRARIFEPFFTTKEKGKGTGLGLSTVFGIVQQSHGTIWCYSEPGVGTTFKIYLPRSERASAAVAAPASAAELRGSETVLLVEDEEPLRQVLRTVLRRAGYQVLDAQNGGEALLLCEQHPGKIDLIVTDIVMPRMSGVQLVERLQQLIPGVPAIYMSGYTSNAAIRHGLLQNETAFLQKPITPEALLRKIRQVLSG